MKRNSLVVFILIFYCLGILIYLSWPGGTPGWLESIEVSILYMLIGVFILIRGETLSDYNIDLSSLVIFILFGTIFRYDNAINTFVSTLFKVGVWGVCGLIIIRIVLRKIPLARPTWSNAIWVSIGLMSGVFLAVPLAYLITHVGDYRMEPVDVTQFTSLGFILKYFAYELSESSIQQEFMFRGLLIGYLLNKWQDEKKAYLVQGLIFWLYHFPSLISWSPLALWVHIPVVTLLESLLTWRSRSLTPAIAAHATYNIFYLIFAILMSSR